MSFDDEDRAVKISNDYNMNLLTRAMCIWHIRLRIWIPISGNTTSRRTLAQAQPVPILPQLIQQKMQHIMKSLQTFLRNITSAPKCADG